MTRLGLVYDMLSKLVCKHRVYSWNILVVITHVAELNMCSVVLWLYLRHDHPTIDNALLAYAEVMQEHGWSHAKQASSPVQ